MFRQFEGMWETEHLTTMLPKLNPAIRVTRETDLFQTNIYIFTIKHTK